MAEKAFPSLDIENSRQGPLWQLVNTIINYSVMKNMTFSLSYLTWLVPDLARRLMVDELNGLYVLPGLG